MAEDDKEVTNNKNDEKITTESSNSSTDEIETGKRDTHNTIKDLKIITAIMLGKDRNKDLSSVLNTDKSFTSKQIKNLEEKGLVRKEGEGKNVRYEIDKFNVLAFLQKKVVLKWKKEE